MNKKGVSLMVSYTILVVIGIVLSVAVFSFLRLTIPPDIKECEDDTSVIIEDVLCSSGELTITLNNRGLFNVEAAFIRLGKEDREVRQQVNIDGVILEPLPITPGGSFSETYPIPFTINFGENYIVEVQPAIIDKKTPIPCDSIVTQKVLCTL